MTEIRRSKRINCSGRKIQTPLTAASWQWRVMSGRRSNHNGNWAKFLKVLLFQRGSGIDTDSRAKFSGQQVLARGFPIEGWAGTCTCCLWVVPRNDRKVFPPISSIGILPGRYNNRGLISLRISSQRSAYKFRRGSADR